MKIELNEQEYILKPKRKRNGIKVIALLLLVVGTSLVAQWLRLHTPNKRGPGSIPGQGTRSLVLQLGVHMP